MKMFKRKPVPVMTHTTWARRETVRLSPEQVMVNDSVVHIDVLEGASYVALDVDMINRLLVEAGYKVLP